MTVKSNPTNYPFRDFVRVNEAITRSLQDEHVTYLLLTGNTGTGKTEVVREVRAHLDHQRPRVIYFAESRRLGSSGFIRVLARDLRVAPSRSHAETVRQVVRVLAEDDQQLLLWFDEAQDLPPETLSEARGLAEADLDSGGHLRILLTGLPRLRADLQAHPRLWRRIAIREEITGLVQDEVGPFLEHLFGATDARRVCEEGMNILFERSKGAPGLLLPMYRKLLASSQSKGKIPPEQVESVIQRWDLT